MNRYKLTGFTLLIAGVCQMIWAGSMDVTLPSEPGIANTDLMLQRELVFLGGGFAFIAGAITLGVERICDHLKQQQRGD